MYRRYKYFLLVVCWRCLLVSDRVRVSSPRSRHVRSWPRDCRSYRRCPCPGRGEGRRRSGCGSDPQEPPGSTDWNGTRSQGHRKLGLWGRTNRSQTPLREAFLSFVPRCRHRRKCRRACPEYPVALSCDSFSDLRHCKWRLHFPSFYQTKTNVVFFLWLRKRYTEIYLDHFIS